MADSHGGTSGNSGIFTATGAAAGATASRAASGSEMPNGGMPKHTVELLYRTAERFGVPVVLLVLVLYWARNDLVGPLLDAHFEFINTIKQAHEKHTDQLQELGVKLDKLIDVSSEK